MRYKAIAIIIAAIIFFGIGLYCIRQSKAVMSGAEGAIAGELTQVLGFKTGIGGIEIESLNSLAVRDVVVLDDSGKRILTSPKVVFSYSPLAVLSGNATLKAVSEIKLFAPQAALARDSAGKWNVEELLSKAHSGRSEFRGQVVIVDGAAAVNDGSREWRADAIDGVLDFIHTPYIGVKLTLRHSSAAIRTEGIVNSRGHGSLSLYAQGLAVADYAALFPPDIKTKVTGGSIKKLQVNVYRDADKTSLAGEAEFAGLAGRFDGLSVTEGRGLATFTGQDVYLYWTAAKVNGQDVKASGRITFAGAEPVLDLKVTADSLDPRALKPDLPFRSAVSLDAAAKGLLSNPQIAGELAFAQGELDGFALKGVQAKFTVSDKVIRVIESRGEAFGGTVSAAGFIDAGTMKYSLRVRGSNIDGSALGRLAPDIRGRAGFDILADGQGSAPEDARIFGAVQIGPGEAYRIGFTGLDASFYKHGSSLTLDYLNVKMGEGAITLSGSGGKDGLRLEAWGSKVPLKSLNGAFWGLGLDGTADFKGVITGTLNQPEAKIAFRAADGQALSQPFSAAEGEIGIAGNMLTLAGVTIHDGMGGHFLQGTISLTGKNELNLSIKTKGIRAENIIKLLAPGEKLTGNVDNEAVVTGPPDNFAAQGKFVLTDGSYDGHLITRMEGVYTRKDGINHIHSLTVDALNAQIKLNGDITDKKELDFDVAAEAVNLAKLHLKFPYPVDGQANLRGKITGSATAPVFRGNLSATGLKLNGQLLEDVAARLSVTKDKIEIPEFTFSQNKGRFNFSGGLNPDGQEVYGSLTVENGRLAGLLSILNQPVKAVDGRLNGYISVSGSVSRPNIALRGQLTGGTVKNYPLDTVDVDLALENNILKINQLFAKQGAGVLAAKGTADLNGPLNLEVGGRDINAGLVTALFNTRVDTRGILSFGAQITGTSVDPHAAVSLEITGGGVNSATFDKLYGLLIYNKGSIHLNQIMITKGPYRASAYGTIPVGALSEQGRQRATIADQMDLKLRLEQADLSILPLFTGEVAWAGGETQGELAISGTLAQPLLNGKFSVRSGTVKLKSLAEPIQKVAVDIQFEGDKINVKTFDGQIGTGSYRLTGSAVLRGLGIEDYKALLVLDKPVINHKYFKGPVDGELVLTEVKGKPHLSGRLAFENDTVDIPFVPEFEPSDIDLGLDLEIIAGSKVHFYNPYLYDIWAAGKVKLAGSTKRPDPSGRIEAVRGSVNYLRTSFKIKSGSAEFTQFRSFEPIIKLRAETKLERTTVNLNLEGPVSAMDLKLTSEPAMNQQELLSLLTLRSHYFDKQKSASGRDTNLGRDELMSLLETGLQIRFVSELESAFRKAFGLDEFRFVRGTLDNDTGGDGKTTAPGSDSAASNLLLPDREVYNVEVGKYISDRMMINYTFGLDHDGRLLGFRYDLNKRISLSGSIDEDNRTKFTLETRFNF